VQNKHDIILYSILIIPTLSVILITAYAVTLQPTFNETERLFVKINPLGTTFDDLRDDNNRLISYDRTGHTIESVIIHNWDKIGTLQKQTIISRLQLQGFEDRGFVQEPQQEMEESK
jgi:hypothetical protein